MQIRRRDNRHKKIGIVKQSYDREADAAYFKIRVGEVSESNEVMPGVIVDYDRFGRIIGVEILEYSKRKNRANEIIEKVISEYGG